ncbi:MAG TPA: T9SS type A sorting domain-containing protein [Bacteroidia bacterium]|jgi:hypothetical protein
MKNLLLSVLAFTFALNTFGQQNYNDFEGNKFSFIGFRTGIIDSMSLNPAMNPVDSSMHCAKYVRDAGTLYDNIQIHPTNELVDISNYASGSINAPHITMKLYTTAPVGTQIQIQLGSAGVPSYPAGVHSEYVAVTTAQNAWQNLSFNFSQITPGGTIAPTGIDKIVILFNPNTNTADEFYFDNLTGPAIAPVSVMALESMPPFKLYQNTPNPAKDLTHINFQLNTPGMVSLRLFDMLGNPIASLMEQNMKAGTYSVPVETGEIPNGIYFYVLKKEGTTRSMKMIVSK